MQRFLIALTALALIAMPVLAGPTAPDPTKPLTLNMGWSVPPCPLPVPGPHIANFIADEHGSEWVLTVDHGWHDEEIPLGWVAGPPDRLILPGSCEIVVHPNGTFVVNHVDTSQTPYVTTPVGGGTYTQP